MERLKKKQKMMIPLWINKAKVEEKLPVARGYLKEDFEKLYIREAQEIDVKPLLCEELYYDCTNNIEQKKYALLIEGGVYEVEGKKVYFEGLATVLSYFAYARFILKSNLVSTSHGFTINDTPYSKPVDSKERITAYHSYRKDAYYYFEGVKQYAERNHELYPLWSCNETCSKNKSESNTIGRIHVGGFD